MSTWVRVVANDPHLLPGQPEAARGSLAGPGDVENSGAWGLARPCRVR